MQKSIAIIASCALLASLCGCGHQADSDPVAATQQQSKDALQSMETMQPEQRQAYVRTHPEIVQMVQQSKDPGLKERFDKLMQAQ